MSHAIGLKHPFQSLWRRAVCHITPALTAFALGALAIMTFDRTVPFVQTLGTIIPPIVMAGQEVEFHFQLYNLDTYSGVAHRWIVDANGIIFQLKDIPTVDLARNQAVEVGEKFPIPCGISVGPAMYHSEVAVAVWWNMVQRYFWPVHYGTHVPFTVKTGFADGSCPRTG